MEEKFKTKLTDYKVDWDKDKLWDKLEPELPVKKSKKRLFLMLMFFVLCGILVMKFYSNETQNVSAEFEKTSSKTEEIVEQKSNSITVTNKTEIENNFGSTQSKTLDKLNPVSNNNIGLNENQLAENSSERNTNKPQKNTTKQKNTKPSLRINSPQSNITTNGMSNAAIKIELGNQDAISEDQVKQPKTEMNEQKIPFKEKSKAFSPQFLSNKAYESVEENQILLEEYDSKVDREIFDIDLLSSGKLHYLKEKNNLKDLQLIDNRKNTFLDKVYVGLDVSIGTLLRDVKPVDANNSNHVVNQNLKQNEYTQFNHSSTLLLTYQLNNQLYFSTGFGIHQLNEKLSWEGQFEKDTVADLIGANIFFWVDMQGDTVLQDGVGPAVVSKYRRVVHYNNIRYYSIPLQLSYEKQFNRVGLSITGGVNLSFAPKYTGKTLINGAENEVEVFLDPRIQSFSIANYYGSLNGIYRFSKNTSLIAGVAYRREGQYVINDLELNYSSWNASVGIRRNLCN